MRKFILACLAIASLTAAQAQKFGYCNSVNILSNLPEVKQADSDLQAFQTQLTKKGQQMVQEFQAAAEKLEALNKTGGISPKEYEAQGMKLQEDQKRIQDYEQEVYAKMGEKREASYKPILEKVNNTMKDVAKEKGLMLVFDTSTQILLYADESLDVTKDVLAKLGVTPGN